MSGSSGALFEEEHEPHENHERYLLTYADMITLLLALFIVLWAVSTVDQAKFDEFRAGLAEGFGNHAIEGGSGVLPGTQSVVNPLVAAEGGVAADVTTTTAAAGGTGIAPDLSGTAGGLPATALEDPTGVGTHVGGSDGLVSESEIVATEEALQGLLDQAGVGADEATVGLDSRGIVVTLNPDVSFPSGQWQLEPGAAVVVDALFGPLGAVSNRISIVGHTDSEPMSGGMSNWELSSLRASSVLRHLVDTGRVPTDRIDGGFVSAVGFGDTRPIASNETAEGRAANRRIELVVEVDRVSDVPAGATVESGDDTATTTPATTPATGTPSTGPASTGGSGATGAHAGESGPDTSTTVSTIDRITFGTVVPPSGN